MHTTRALVAADPLRFGRGREFHSAIATEIRSAISDDLKLFASTFIAGFLFVSILVA